MTWVVTAIVGSTAVGLYSANRSASAQEKGIDAQSEAIANSSEDQLEVALANIAANEANLDKIIQLQKDIRAEQNELAKPWQEAGVEALDYVKRGFDEGWLQQETIGDFDFKKFDYHAFDRRQFDAPESFEFREFEAPEKFEREEFEFEADPGYAFRKEEGLNALNARAAARGRNASPATDKVVQRYVQGLASQEYGNAFNRYLQTTDRDYQYYSDDYSRQRYNYDADRGFAYGVYSDDYERDYRDFRYDEDRRYDQYLKTGYFEADQHWKQQGVDYGNYVDGVNSRNAAKGNMLNTAMGVAGLGQGGTNMAATANYNYGNNVSNALNTTTAGNNAARTNAGNNVTNLTMGQNFNQPDPWGAYSQTVNSGMENYLLYNMYTNG